jgi:hypothetical protein
VHFPTRRSRSRLLVSTMAVLLATDAAGGLLEVAAGRNTLASAWGSEATLCAPYPMIAFQVVAVLVIIRSARLPGRLAAVLLAAACLVSFVSGFLDGQLARADLSGAEVGFQAWLLGVTAFLGVAAALFVRTGGAADAKWRSAQVAAGVGAAGKRVSS